MWTKAPLIRFGLALGFQNIEYYYVHGSRARLIIGSGCSTANAVFNTMSGRITVGNDTLFGHEVMLLTGTHQFYRGIRAKLTGAPIKEVPNTGRDIEVGKGCFIGSRAIIIGPVKIGENTIVGAGSVVTRDLPAGCFAAGVPARVIRNDLNSTT